MKLLYNPGNLTGIKNLTSYVYTALQNGAKDYYKKRNNETLTGQNIDQETQILEEKILINELKQVIMQAIDRLDEKQKFVFFETEVKGRSYDKLVRQTGEKLGTLLSRKNRAIKKLRRMIEEYIYEED